MGNAIYDAMKLGVNTAVNGFKSVVGGAKNAYASYEQLAGGVKKLYGDASEAVLENARNAYKTSGMSANQYMQQATSFSAALISSLNGDVGEAARLTEVAMNAMSDNVNTFGTDMQSVQYAFQGFSKQNYTIELMSAA
jgi:hypothetical protein